jgi:hypothetical protein
MKKILFLASLLLAATAMASPVTQSEAQRAAAAFMLQHRPGVTMKATPASAPRMNAGGPSSASSPSYYVFNTDGGHGYVIVSGDNRTTQILGYSDNGSFDPAHVPANMQVWLDNYSRQIAALDEMGISEVDFALRAPKPTRNSISPMLTSNWDQATPYWNHCPEFMSIEDGDTIGEFAYTGCVATAMAQIMNYYHYPSQCTQTIPSYQVTYADGDYNYGTFYTETLEPKAFDWTNMRDNYTGSEDSVSTEAVSWLMYYVGCSVKMQYGITASGTSDPYIPIAFNDYFDYDARLVYRSDYEQADWEEMIYQELAAGRPMVYNGRAGSGGGHSFVCDGYAYGDYFHINWGWGGMGNGYFVLSVLNPRASGIGGSTSAEGYNIDQTAIIGIKPGYSGPDAVEHVLTVYNMYSSGTSLFERDSSTQGFKLTKRKYVKVTAEDHINDGTKYKRGIALYDSNDNFVQLIASTSYYSASLSITDSWPDTQSSTTYSFGAGITSGTYKIKPVCQVQGSDDWTPMLESDRYYCAVTFNGNTCSFTDHPITDLQSTNFEFVGQHKVGSPEQCNVTVKNNSADRFTGRLFLYVSGEQIDEYGEYTTVVETEIPAGGTKVVTFNFTPQNAGSKTAYLSTADNTWTASIPGTGHVTIAGSTTSAMNLSVDINALGADDEMYVYDNFVRFKVDITNNGAGEYNKYVLAPLFIINEITGTGEMVTYQNQAVDIPAGTTKTLYFDFDNLGYGYKYALNIYARNENDSLKNLVQPGQSKIYEIVHGVVVWTGDGERMGYQPCDNFQVPAAAAAVNLEGLEMNSIVPNANPNCLYYMGREEAVPAGLEGRNVIKGNVAQGTIQLKHGFDYCAPFRFTASSMSYERTFTQGRHAGQEGGWSTMVLPFTATAVTADGAAIDWMHSRDDAKGLWVCNFANEEDTADEGQLLADYVGSSIDANVPYFVAPYDGANGTDMRNKTFVFTGTDVTVKPNPSAITSGTYHMTVGDFFLRNVEDAYFLNAAGSHFVKAANGTVNAFEVYTDNVVASDFTSLLIVLDEDAESAAVALRGDVNNDQKVDIDDVTRLIDVVLGKNVEYNAMAADCETESGDGQVNINDVTALISYVLTGQW